MLKLKEILYNDQVIDDYCTMFRTEVALDPIELETFLGCSRTERLRWTKEGKLPVMFFGDVFQLGMHMIYPCFDRRIIGLKVTDHIVSLWRANWIKRKRRRRRVGEERPDIRKVSILKDAYRLNIDSLFSSWYHIDEELGICFELAYWASILSYYIRIREQKAYIARAHYYDHKRVKEKKNSNMLQLNFIVRLDMIVILFNFVTNIII